MRLSFAIVVCVCGLAGCAHPQAADAGGDDADWIQVYRSDGARQCAPDSGTALEAMADELTAAGVTVHCARKASDGRMRTAMCGAASGTINVYAIHPRDTGRAAELGFSPVTALPDYVDEGCER